LADWKKAEFNPKMELVKKLMEQKWLEELLEQGEGRGSPHPTKANLSSPGR